MVVNSDKITNVVERIMRRIEGSTTQPEAQFLYQTVRPQSVKGAIVEIGSFLGKSTIVLAKAANSKIYAIDPHWGEAVIDKQFSGPTYPRFIKNLETAGVRNKVIVIKKTSQQAATTWKQKIGLLFIDGDHSYEGVYFDLTHYGKWVVLDGMIILHDAVNPGDGPPRAIVNCLLTKPNYKHFGIVGSMLYCQKGRPQTVRQWSNWLGFAIVMRTVSFLIRGSIFIQQIVVKRWVQQWLNR